MAALIIGTAAYQLRASRGFWFFYDEWIAADLTDRGVGLLEPYNGHLSIVWRATYRAVFEVWGLEHYLPLRVLGIVALAAAPATLYVTTRRPLGPALAGAIVAVLVWYPSISFEPGGFNHSLVLSLAIVTAALLRTTARRADGGLAVTLTLAFLSAGGAVAVAAAALVHSALSGATPRRWAAVVTPSAAWGVWWLALGRSSITERPASVAEAVRIVLRGLFGAFEGLALGSTIGGALLLGLFAIGVARQLRTGRRAAAATIAWTSALIVWWVGLAVNRGDIAQADTFRYQVTGSVFVVLASVPMLEAVREHARRPAVDRWAPLAMVAVTGLAIAAGASDLRAFVDRQEAFGKATRMFAAVSDLGPEVVPDDHRLNEAVGSLTAGRYRDLAEHYGGPTVGATPEAIDAAVLRAMDPIVDVTTGGLYPGCEVLDGPVELTPRARLTVHAGTKTVDVTLQRFGDEPVPLVTLAPSSDAVVWLEALDADEPWRLRADGACL